MTKVDRLPTDKTNSLTTKILNFRVQPKKVQKFKKMKKMPKSHYFGSEMSKNYFMHTLGSFYTIFSKKKIDLRGLKSV